MIWFLYRLNGGEVIGATVNSDGFGTIDTRFYGTIQDPLTPDGKDLAIPKICIPAQSTVRNATPEEIANFLIAQEQDAITLARYQAEDFAENHPITRKVMRAIVQLMVNEINILRTEIRTRHPQADLPDRTLQQAKTAMLNIITGGTVD